MLNRYPLWKNLLVAFVIGLGVLYALPNLYPPDFAVQISNESADGSVDERVLEATEKRLGQAQIPYFGAELKDNRVLVRFVDGETQLAAKQEIEYELADLKQETNQTYIAALNLAPTTPEWLANIGGAPMKYGLDLRGGVHFLFQVDTQAVIAERVKGLEDEIKDSFRAERIRYQNFQQNIELGNVSMQFKTDEIRSEARSLLIDKYPQHVIAVDPATEAVSVTFTDAMIREIEDFAVQQNIQSIRNRVNELGVAEPLVQKLGRDRIVVDLPGVQDTALASRLLGKVATLEFRMEALPDAARASTIQFDYEGFDVSLEADLILRGDRVLDASVGYDPETGLPQVNITLDGVGGELMHAKTWQNVGRRMGVVYIETKTERVKTLQDGQEVFEDRRYVTKRVISLATVQSALGVQFRITGLQQGEARELALLLRSGALAADMFVAEERTVGASLGAENIELGAFSVSVGLGLVVIFMLVYYKIFGIAANIALTANLVLLVAIMSSLSATLTLPGIAGIVLTVGMAVDANVLIFSRIKEEIKNGLPPQQAIHAGFERAFVTILDAKPDNADCCRNSVQHWYGSGERICRDTVYRHHDIDVHGHYGHANDRQSDVWRAKRPEVTDLMAVLDLKIDFMAYRKIAGIISIIIVLASLGSLIVNQVEWGLDFTGGSLIELEYEAAANPEKIRDQLTAAGYEGHVVQFFGSDRDVLIRIPPQKGLDQKENAQLGNKVIESLQEASGEDANIGLRRNEFVGPAVGEELTNQGGIGLMTALGVVLLYVAFRFQLKFAVGAVVALFHDVVITLGIFSVIRWNFDLTVLAALLAVIGYSLNDTIVVSDRIRENFRKIRRSQPIEVINTSLNQTLGRTLVTSFTTLLVLFTLLILGGELIQGFAIGLIIGVMVGTYSSIYVASNMLLVMNISQEDLAVPEKEGANDPDMLGS